MQVSSLSGRERMIWGTWGEHEEAEDSVTEKWGRVKIIWGEADCIRPRQMVGGLEQLM